MKWIPCLYPTLLSLLLFLNASRQAPGPDLGGVAGVDKILHILFFGLLAITILRIPAIRHRNLGWLTAWCTAIAVGLLDEWLQSFTPFRTTDPVDLFADAFGSALALFFYLKWARFRNLLEKPVIHPRKSVPGNAS